MIVNRVARHRMRNQPPPLLQQQQQQHLLVVILIVVVVAVDLVMDLVVDLAVLVVAAFQHSPTTIPTRKRTSATAFQKSCGGCAGNCLVARRVRLMVQPNPTQSGPVRSGLVCPHAFGRPVVVGRQTRTRTDRNDTGWSEHQNNER